MSRCKCVTKVDEIIAHEAGYQLLINSWQPVLSLTPLTNNYALFCSCSATHTACMYSTQQFKCLEFYAATGRFKFKMLQIFMKALRRMNEYV